MKNSHTDRAQSQNSAGDRFRLTTIGVLMTGYSLATIAFIGFGFATGDLSSSYWVDISIRTIFSIASLLVAYRIFIKKINFISVLWPLCLAVLHFLLHPTGVFSNGFKTWLDISNTPMYGTGVSPFKALYIIFDILLGLSLLLSVKPLRNSIALVINKTQFAKLFTNLVTQRREEFKRSGLLAKIAGFLLLGWVLVDVFVIATGIVNSKIDISNGSWDTQVELIFAVSIVYLLIRSGWDSRKVAWLVALVGVWEFVISEQISYFSTTASGLWELYKYPALNSILTVQTYALFGAFVTVAFAIIQIIVRAQSSKVHRWIDSRIAEIYKEEKISDSMSTPRTTSILAVFSLIFAFVFPIVGLILAHAARNEIAISRGSKFGTDMTVAAAVISWLFIGIFAIAILFTFVFLPLLGTYWLSNLLYTIGL